MTMVGRRPQRPMTGEHPNYIRESLPDAQISDTGSEEVEIETGISIVDRQILTILGLVHTGTENAFIDALADNASSQTQLFTLNLQTRTGEQFDTADPETVLRRDWVYRLVSDGTNTRAIWHVVEDTPVPDGGQLVASPRLVYRQDNDLGQAVAADEYQTRIAYEFTRMDAATVFQLVEMQADIFFV